jgi:enoyl-CoA hydratase/carnithine racemase
VSTDPTETVPTAARFLLLNRPERRNALVPDLARKLAAEVRAAEQDKGIRAVALRGAGGHFSVGLDLKWYLTLGDTPPRSVLEEGLRAFQDTIRAVVRSPLPIIALLEGSVAELRVRSDGARPRRGIHVYVTAPRRHGTRQFHTDEW